MYMQQVMIMLQFQGATRQGEWFLYLSTLEKLTTMFFAFNRLDYAQNILEYIARMYDMKTEDHQSWTEMVEGTFTVNTSVGYQTSPQTLLKFCLSAPELSKLTLEIEQMLGLGLNEHTKHYSDNEPKSIVKKNQYVILTRCL